MAKEMGTDALQYLMSGGRKGGAYGYTNKKGKTVFSATGYGINKDYKRDNNTYTGSNAPDGGKGGWTIAGYNQTSGYNAKGGGSVNSRTPIWKRVDGADGGKGKGGKGGKGNTNALPKGNINPVNPNPGGQAAGSGASANTALQEALSRVAAWDASRRGEGPDPGASMPRTQSNLPTVMRNSPHLKTSGEGASNLYAGILEKGMGLLDNASKLQQEYSDRTEATRLQSKQDLADRIRNYRGTIPDYANPFAKEDGKKSLYAKLKGDIA